MTALPARPLLPIAGGEPASEEGTGFAMYRRLARLSTGAAAAGVYLIHEPEPGEAGRAVWEGLGEGDHSRPALLARRVMLAGEPVVLSAADGDGDEAREQDRVASFLGVPVGSLRTRFRGCVCVMDTVAREWSRDQIRALRDIAGLIERDLSRRPVVEERYALETVVRMLAKAVDNMQLGVTITDLAGRIVYTNPAEARMHGYTVDELMGRSARVLGPPEHFRALDPDRTTAASWTRETVNVRRDGSRFPVLLWSDLVTDASGSAVGMVTCCEDITERKEAEAALREVAMRDPLTALPNRTFFHERLITAIAGHRMDPTRRFAVLFLDLDRFKVVNDSLGHHVGDELLRVVASRLRACVRPQDTVSRFGGDEFAVLLEDVGAGQLALRVAERIRQSLATPIELGGYELVTSASIGIVESAAHMGQPEHVWQAADMAMYRAKSTGAGRFEVFDRNMHLEAMSRLKVETDLRRALEKEEFRLEYQPVVDLALGCTVGFEALVRWDHPERGEVPPAEFIGVAEETGLMVRLGEWVVREACRDARRWQDHAGGRPVWVGVNLSARQLAQPGLAEGVRRAMSEAGIGSELLKVEVTETGVIAGAELAAEGMRRIRETGVQIFLDDFGTGYASLSYLHRLPIDAVKIDRSFVGELKSGERQKRLLEGVIRLARSADLRVIAEGVSEQGELEVLAQLGCDMVQGYLFSPALAPESIPRHLAAS